MLSKSDEGDFQADVGSPPKAAARSSAPKVSSPATKTFFSGMKLELGDLDVGVLSKAENQRLQELEDEKPDLEKPKPKPKQKASKGLGKGKKRQDSSTSIGKSPRADGSTKSPGKGSPKRQDSSASISKSPSSKCGGQLQRLKSSANLGGEQLQRLKSSANLGQDADADEKVAAGLSKKKNSKPAKIEQPPEAEEAAEPKKKRCKRTDEDIKNMSKAARKKLLTSRAYHITRDSAVRRGVDAEEAKRLGRLASQKVAERLDKDDGEIGEEAQAAERCD